MFNTEAGAQANARVNRPRSIFHLDKLAFISVIAKSILQFYADDEILSLKENVVQVNEQVCKDISKIPDNALAVMIYIFALVIT